MKHFILLLALILNASLWLDAQDLGGENTVSGKIIDAYTEAPVFGAKVILKDTEYKTETDVKGNFTFKNIPDGTYMLLVSGPEHQTVKKEFVVDAELKFDLGTIKMTPSGSNDVIIELSESELENADESSNESISGILHGSKDVFMSVAGYTFGPLRFRIRGYDNEYTSLYMNGIKTNDMESGRPFWSLWGGLNDAVRNKETYKGIHANDFGFAGLGGASNIDTRASHMRKQTKLTYSYSNRTYTNRAMFIHSTGMMENGLALSLSGSRRVSLDDVMNGHMESYIKGTYYDAWAYFLSAEKRFNEHHSIGFVGFGSPNNRGKRGGTTQEVYDLTGSNFYNPYWGWQDGKRRNSRTTESHKPFGMLTHYWDINKKTSLTTSLAYIQGAYTTTSLNWYNAPDPRPDYYRYLPSYMNTQEAVDLRTAEFQNGERQIQWDTLYYVNRAMQDTILAPNGNEDEILTGYKSEYITEERRNDEVQYSFNTLFKTELNDNFNLTAGINYRDYLGSHYKVVRDLLGGDFIVDIDKYAERDFPGQDGVSDSDIRFPNRIVREGDRFGYDYDANVKYGQAWAQLEGSFKRIDFYIADEFNYTNFWRTGNMQNGKFPDNSLGDSEKHSFTNLGAKAGVLFKITGRHYIRTNAMYKTKAPDFRDAFVSARTRNEVISNLENEQNMSIDAGYVLRAPKIKASLDVFYTEFRNQVWVRSFYFDGYRSFINFAMTGIDKKHQGAELGLEYQPLPGLTLSGVASVGYYRWTSRPEYTITVDNSSEVYIENETVYADGYLVSGTPQTAFSAGVQYWAPKYWFVGVSGSFLDDRYLSFSPISRTTDALEEVDKDSELYSEIVQQELLDSSFTLDLFAGKSFRIDHKYYINISLNVSNLLDNTDIKTGGYEQLRLDADLENPDKFPPKYYYYYGRQYFLNISFRF